jgi:hypothetical protein
VSLGPQQHVVDEDLCRFIRFGLSVAVAAERLDVVAVGSVKDHGARNAIMNAALCFKALDDALKVPVAPADVMTL